MIMGVTKLAIFMAIKQKAEFFMQDPSFVNNAESKFRFFFSCGEIDSEWGKRALQSLSKKVQSVKSRHQYFRFF